MFPSPAVLKKNDTVLEDNRRIRQENVAMRSDIIQLTAETHVCRVILLRVAAQKAKAKWNRESKREEKGRIQSPNLGSVSRFV